MLSRPTTEQILLDCREELLAKIAPALPPGEAAVAVQMMENVLRNCAARAAHEIAWMREEGEAMLDLARRVASSSASTPELAAAISAHDGQASASLHLDDVVATYALAGACFEAALDAASAADDDDLVGAARAILEQRLAHENQIMGEWAFVGRA